MATGPAATLAASRMTKSVVMLTERNTGASSHPSSSFPSSHPLLLSPLLSIPCLPLPFCPSPSLILICPLPDLGTKMASWAKLSLPGLHRSILPADSAADSSALLCCNAVDAGVGGNVTFSMSCGQQDYVSSSR